MPLLHRYSFSVLLLHTLLHCQSSFTWTAANIETYKLDSERWKGHIHNNSNATNNNKQQNNEEKIQFPVCFFYSQSDVQKFGVAKVFFSLLLFLEYIFCGRQCCINLIKNTVKLRKISNSNAFLQIKET